MYAGFLFIKYTCVNTVIKVRNIFRSIYLLSIYLIIYITYQCYKVIKIQKIGKGHNTQQLTQ